MPIPICWIVVIDGVGAIYMSDQRIFVWLVASAGCVSSDGLLLKVFHWVLGEMLLVRTCLGIWSIRLELFTGWDWCRDSSI